ncbi:substrate-binding domain-containing protein [Paenibacillus macerans]|uniref:substrate-binding domain-containing protein n=1 Tax=Paenibacillus macerans TaxID=44252 RepID=UPI003D31D3E8
MRGRMLILGSCVLLAALLWGAFHYVNQAASPKTPVIWYVPKSLDAGVEFWVVAEQGVTAASKEYGVHAVVKGTATEEDIDGQIAILQQALKEKPDAVILAASDRQRLLPAAKALTEAGIRLVTVDSGLEGGGSASFIGTDNYAAGQQAGMMMADALGGEGLVGIINTVRGSETAWERERGVRDVLRQHPRIAVMAASYTGSLQARAYDAARELLRSEPELAGIVALNEPTAVGAARAIAELGDTRPRVKLIGFDSSRSEVMDLEQGLLDATVVQKPFNMGYLAVKTAMDLLHGRKVEPVVDTGSVVITKRNMYARENQKLLFPFVEEPAEGR